MATVSGRSPLSPRASRGSFDDLGNEIQTCLDARGDRLEEIALVHFGYRVFTQPQDNILRVRHGLDATDVHGLHLLDHPENTHELRQRGVGFGVVDRDAGKARRTFDVFTGQGHLRQAHK